MIKSIIDEWMNIKTIMLSILLLMNEWINEKTIRSIIKSIINEWMKGRILFLFLFLFYDKQFFNRFSIKIWSIDWPMNEY